MANPFLKENRGVEFKPQGNITAIYDLMSREHDSLKTSDQPADEKVVKRVMKILAGKQVLCLGEFVGHRLVIG